MSTSQVPGVPRGWSTGGLAPTHRARAPGRATLERGYGKPLEAAPLRRMQTVGQVHPNHPAALREGMRMGFDSPGQLSSLHTTVEEDTSSISRPGLPGWLLNLWPVNWSAVSRHWCAGPASREAG